MTLPPLPELPTLDCTNTARVLFVRWATQYGQDCATYAVQSCRKLCDDYSKHLIATGEPSTPSEWEAHGAESCANLIGGLSEYGDPPESEHFAGTYAALRAEKTEGQWGASIVGQPEYQAEQREKNRRARALLDAAAKQGGQG